MKKLYSFLLFSLLITGCSKDFFKAYEDRLVGTWELVDVNRRGIGGNTFSLPFRYGSFTFMRGGTLNYTDENGVLYKGSWDTYQQWSRGNCYTDDYGYTNCDERTINVLELNAIDFITQKVKAEHFDEIVFTGTNKFKAYVYAGLHTYIFHFRR